MAKYKYGDRVRVRTNGTHKIGKVVNITGNSYSGYTCTVDFDNPPVVVPQQMDFPEYQLEMYEEKTNVFGHWINTGEICPICKEKWHIIESPMFGKKEIWIDCIKCKKTKKQIMKEIGK